MTPPLIMHSKFVLPNWTVFTHILKWVRQWSVIGDHYCEHSCDPLPQQPHKTDGHTLVTHKLSTVY